MTLNISERFQQWVSGVDPVEWLIAAAAAIVCYLVLTAVLRVVISRAEKLATKTTTHLDDNLLEIARATRHSVLVGISLLVGVHFLTLGRLGSFLTGQLWFALLALQMGFWGHRAIEVGLRSYRLRNSGSDQPAAQASSTLLGWALRSVLWAVVILAILSNVGVNITAFVASLGIGGVAVALAVQNVLGDLFASMSIAVDKPFEVGDFIVVGPISGTVEQLGLKTTRIRSISGEQIVMSNAGLLKQTIANYKRLQSRRIVFTFGITYDATPDQVEAVPPLVKEIIDALPDVTFNRAHFKGFGDSSLDFEVVYFVNDPSYDIYMDRQQAINLALMRALPKHGVDFAFPTRTVHVVRHNVEDTTSLPQGTQTEAARRLEDDQAAASAA
jgi:small-conductance mechanosensitive channel